MAGRRRTLTIFGSIALAASAAWAGAYVLPVVRQAPATPARVTTARAPREVLRVEPTDPKQLNALLPEAVAGLKRVDAEAGRRSIGEMRSSFAEATFGAEGNPARNKSSNPAATQQSAGSVSIKIVDYIGMPGLVESVAPWHSLDIETQTDDEYSRTLLIDGHKAMETYAKQTLTGSLNVLVAQRFVVTIEATGLPPETLRQAAKTLKLDALAAMAK